MNEGRPPFEHPAASAVEQHEDEPPGSSDISLLDLLIVLAKHKWLVIGLPFVAGIAAIVYSLMLPPTYTAQTKILPPQGQSASAGIVAQLGGLAALAASAGLKNPNDLYIGMLKSRTVADNLIQRFDLMKVFGSRYVSQARATLEAVTKIETAKDGIITIRVEDQDAKRAAALANAYIEELGRLTNVLAVTEASQRRVFFERRFAQARDDLAKAESAARQSLQKGGLVQVEGQSRAIIETTARLRGQITVKEVQIGAMRAFATGQNPELIAAQRELEAMRQELARLEGAGAIQTREERPNATPGMDSVRMLRNVKYHETIYELLAKQYELAKLDESKEAGLLQVLDPAIEPDFRSGPKRTQIVLTWTLLASILAVLLAFAREALQNSGENPRRVARMQALKHYLRGRRA